MNYRLKTFSFVVLGAAALFAARSALPTTGSAGGAVVETGVAGTMLESRPLYDGSELSMPTRMAVAGDRLVVLDALGRTAVHLLDRHSGALLESFGGRGEGPGEFRGPRSIDVLPGGEGFWIHDVNLQRSTLYPVDPGRPVDFIGAGPAAAENRDHRWAEIVTFADGAGVIEPIRVGDRILAAGMFERGRLGHLDAEGRFVRASGPLPSVPEGVSAYALQFIHQGALRGTPARDRFALSSLSFSRIELYDRQGVRRALVQAPIELKPEIVGREVGGKRSAIVSPESPAGYTDVTVTGAAIYALYSGRDPAVYRDEAIYGRQVHVFAWSGEFVGALDLDYAAIAIAVSPDGSELYGLRHLPAPEIRRHTLPRRLDLNGAEDQI